MRKKLIVGALTGVLILGGAVAVGASKNDTRPEDSMEYKVELNTSSGETEVRIDAETGKVVRVERDDDNKADDDGAHQNRHSGDDDNKADNCVHQNRHSGDGDNKADNGAHQNGHSGDDDTKADDDNI